MSGGINSYRFKLQYEGVQRAELDKREKLVQQLEKLSVKINQPDEVDMKHLELLVNHHRKTVEERISREQLEVAKSNGLSEEDVNKRVDDLNWDVKNAVNVRKVEKNEETKAQRRARRNAEMKRILAQLHAEEEQAK